MDSLLADGRRAHLERDADLLAASLADTLVSISDGAVTASPKDSVRAMFGRYFTDASYRAWDDVAPPRIIISDDNSLAWVSRVVCVDREEPAPEGGRRRRLFVSAYTATYHVEGGRLADDDRHQHFSAGSADHLSPTSS